MAILARDYIREQRSAPSGARREHNACLSALPADALALLKPYLSGVALFPGTVLWDTGQRSRNVYFPITGLISVVLPMSSGDAVEVATVSHQGAAGSLLDPRAEEPVTRGLVQISGTFVQIVTEHLQEVAARNRAVDRMLDLCRDWMAAQAQQTAACNAVHEAPKRLCRWLAHNAEKMETGTLNVTQDMLGSLLGIRRTTVTLIAQQLHAQGLIDYSRGKIRVTDLEKLEAASCECCRTLSRSQWPASRLAALRAEEVG
jgi:CRP-like cAMP-binding protein